jgi:uncharacterized iron-regulated membrane protein
MSRIRPVLFWLHLGCGVTAGLVIAVMCFTGTALTLEKSTLAWVERHERTVSPPAGADRLGLRELRDRVRQEFPDQSPNSVIVGAGADAAVTFMLGRDEVVYVDPYSGAVLRPPSQGIRAFFQTMENWHRALGAGGDGRAIGRAITGAANAVFLGLAMTGLFLWIPRQWSWSGLRAVAVLNFRATGKARDFNWHNTVGVWCAPILIVLTLTALPMSYRWANNLLYRTAGSQPPDNPGPGSAPPTPGFARPENVRPLGLDAQLAIAQHEYPRWESITFRLGAGRRPSEGRSAGPRNEPAGEHHGERTTPPTVFTVHLRDEWPNFSNATLTLNPYTGEIVKREAFTDAEPGRRLRSWARFLHTGEAFGWVGQLVAALGALGGCVLAYTGISLACRRFFRRRTAGLS